MNTMTKSLRQDIPHFTSLAELRRQVAKAFQDYFTEKLLWQQHMTLMVSLQHGVIDRIELS